ncbi:hypothetical protein I41_09040 [Lacipirellula limnantheis]|uniref:Uracil DNA glycosylase superfamily protein n=1 Tax=Lacipirellula limnantheis TaxID=2528024 RepID=A0A517TTP0_9BACT|nr:hypothetical protein I41_09040 [Lacipirellula limnantheis]
MTLQRFIEQFLGYGSLSAPLWLVGMEEAGGTSPRDLECRVAAWNECGGEPVVDLMDFHHRIGCDQYFGVRPKRQVTWARLAQIVLAWEGLCRGRDAVLAFQSQHLGRKGGTTLLAELMPLPKATVTSWPYAPLATRLPYLRSVGRYRDAVLPKRVELLSEAIRSHSPKAVVFYGMSYRQHWIDIAQVPFASTGTGSFFGCGHHTTYLVTSHPNARGLEANYFVEQGRILGELTEKRGASPDSPTDQDRT